MLHVHEQHLDEGQQLPAQQNARSVRVAESIQDVLEQLPLLDVLPREAVRAFLSTGVGAANGRNEIAVLEVQMRDQLVVRIDPDLA